MKAVIAAAGLGTRLIPQTLTRPKCLLKVRDEEIIKHQVKILENLDVDEIIVVVGYLENEIREVLKDRVIYIVNNEFKTTNSSFSFRKAISEADDSVIYINSDLYFTENMIKQLLNFKYKNAILTDSSEIAESDMFKFQGNGNQITRLSKDLDLRISDGVAVGPVILNREGIQKIIEIIDGHILSNNKNEWVYSVVNELSQFVKLYSIDIKKEMWFEIDTYLDLENCRSFYE